MESPVLEKLKTEVEMLNRLLQHPEEGLFSWSMMVGQRWKAIAELWDGPKKD